MSSILKGIPALPQRQDSVTDQLNDLVRVANRLGMHDAADVIRQMFAAKRFASIEYGCHLELDLGQEPDDCVINTGNLADCMYAKNGMRPEQCEYWRPKCDTTSS